MALAIATGWVLDRLLGDPARWHPVAGFGLLATALERRCWRPSRAAGMLFAGGMIAATALATRAVDRTLLPWRHARFAFRAIVIWTTLGGRSLDTAASRLAAHVEAGDLASRAGAGADAGRARPDHAGRSRIVPRSRGVGRRERERCRCCSAVLGGCCWGRPAPPPTGRSTRLTRWSAIAATAIGSSAGRPPVPMILPTGHPRGWRR